MTRVIRAQSVWLAIVGFGVMAGAAFLFVKVLVGELTPMQVVGSRTLAGSLAVGGVIVVTRTSVPVSVRFVRSVFVLGVLDGVAPYLLMAYGQVHVTSSLAAIFVSTMPLFTTLFAMWSSRERSAGPASVLGVAGGFAGVAVLAGPGSFEFGAGNSPAMIAMLFAAVCYAAATVYARGLLEVASPLALTGAKLTVAAGIVVPLAVVIDGTGNFSSMSNEGWLSLAALGLGSTGLGRALYLWAVGKAGSVKASLVTYVAPVVAIGLGWAVLGETVDARMLAGAALIVSGVASAMFSRQIEATLRDVLARKPVQLTPRVES